MLIRDWRLDLLKILMSILVVLLHMASYRTSEGYMFWFPNFIEAAGRTAVPIFFMIAGANLFRRPKPTKQVYVTAYRRILQPLIVWSAFYIVYRLVFWLEPITSTVSGTLMSGAFYHMSFLNRMLFLYVLAPIVQKSWRQINVLEIIVITFCVFLADNLMNRGYLLFYARDLYPVGYALLGAFLVDQCDKAEGVNSVWKKVILGSGICIIATLCTCYFTMRVSFEANQLRQIYLTYDNPLILLAAISLFLSIKIIPEKVLSINGKKVIQKISSATFGVYLLHPAFIDFVLYQRWARWFAWELGFSVAQLSNWQFILVGGMIVWSVSMITVSTGNYVLNKLKRICITMIKRGAHHGEET